MSYLEIWPLYTPHMMRGFSVTLQLAVVGILSSLVVGLVLVVMRLWMPRIVRAFAIGFVDVVRGTPELLLIFLIYFGFSQYGLLIPAFAAATLWLAIVGGANASEIFRAGIEAVDKGQIEAGSALGHKPVSVFVRIIFPQALIFMLPPLANHVILMVKATALAYTIGLTELMGEANKGSLATYRSMPFYLYACACYLTVCIPLSQIAKRLEAWTIQRR
jgi:His/Glu/Gln/Arg/opine family amino acid ABC transporter permease subunit